LPAELRRQLVIYPTQEVPGSIVIDTPHTYLYYVVGGGRAIRPLGARAMYLSDTYLSDTQYRIHGTSDPATIGKKVSSGCVRLTNEDVIDLYGWISLGSKVVVPPDTSPQLRGAEAGRSDDRRISSHQIPQQLGASVRAPAGPGPVTAAFGLY
jgi:hypothetical protein